MLDYSFSAVLNSATVFYADVEQTKRVTDKLVEFLCLWFLAET